MNVQNLITNQGGVMLRAICIFSILFFSSLSFSQRGGRANTVRSLLAKTQKLEQAISFKGHQMSSQQKSHVSSLLREAIQAVNGFSGGGGNSGGGHGQMEAIYQAKCHVDDDQFLDFDQFSGGVLTGSIQQILSECKQRALAMHGSHSSSGIKKLQLINAPRSNMIAICHIDDDQFLDFDQFVIGKIAGLGTADIKSKCDSIAKSVFGSSSSSGLKFL